MEDLVDHEEQLFLIDLVVEALEQLLHWSEVGLNLLLGVVVHAQPHLGSLAAGEEALDLAHVAELVVSVDVEHVVELCGLVLGDLVAVVQDGEVLLLEPLAGHLHNATILFLVSKFFILHLFCSLQAHDMTPPLYLSVQKSVEKFLLRTLRRVVTSPCLLYNPSQEITKK